MVHDRCSVTAASTRSRGVRDLSVEATTYIGHVSSLVCGQKEIRCFILARQQLSSQIVAAASLSRKFLKLTVYTAREPPLVEASNERHIQI
jgi:hypothetical protein